MKAPKEEMRKAKIAGKKKDFSSLELFALLLFSREERIFVTVASHRLCVGRGDGGTFATCQFSLDCFREKASISFNDFIDERLTKCIEWTKVIHICKTNAVFVNVVYIYNN